MKQNISYNIVILAAGASARLGRPKQLLVYNNANLLQHAVNEAVKTSANEVIVVVGANMEEISNSIKTRSYPKLSIVENDRWQEGISSSIKKGVEHSMQKDASIGGLILMVCDQPFVDATLLMNLVNTHHETGKPIVASRYKDAVGTPVYFNRSFFPELLKLTGDTGAKKIIMGCGSSDVALIEFSRGDIDIDTEDDFSLLKQQH